MGRRRHAPLVMALAVLASSGCSALAAEKESILDQDGLVIGVKADQPGLGLEVSEGQFEGFDVDVATYIADHLGFEESDLRFVEVPSAAREYVLMKGEVPDDELPDVDDEVIDGLEADEVDMVIATYSITPARGRMVNFAGPYYVARQDIMTQAGDESVDDVRDLDGTTICQGAGSNSANRIVEGRGVDAAIEEPPTYGECFDMLEDGSVDAVSTDDLILAGFALDNPTAFRMVNAPFTAERYGVGLRQSDVAGCEEVNRAITSMYRTEAANGADEDDDSDEGDISPAQQMLEQWFGETGLELTTSVPQFDGCG
ncbi:transporter substrate-binding domain-containing protein [Spiractinospora alimapuensis]|uniref:transporter substrate-binding domain-containing protein n=1 Tax=Spiractinospora alimapuensis TaxID=2820884 RepID=UPI001F209B8E|nr:transporter substrate-binding domain-containing protein [Spiractinospora alimapuensis]QVQ52016.1 transporter substrate-binding domain-containing protein [Spiractinospora alimapuensis]